MRLRDNANLAGQHRTDLLQSVAITSGVGKTHIAVALAVAACRAGFTVYFTTLDDMVRQLTAADAIGRLTGKLRTYLRPTVLVIDEVGYQPLERAEANLVFQVISKRYEKGSTLLTSNKSFGEWGQVFGDEVLATAILDRLLPLRRHRHQRPQLPAQEPPHRHRRQRQHRRRQRRITPTRLAARGHQQPDHHSAAALAHASPVRAYCDVAAPPVHPRGHG
jgi:hypothetical protein